MKIEKIHTHILDYKLDQAFESASMRFERRQHCLVEVVCDDGTVGWGECLGPAKANAAVVDIYAAALIGRNPLETEKLWLDLYNRLRDQGQRGLTVTALSGLDIALWDIKGKRYGAPISELLGGRFRDSVRAYATGSFRRDGVDRVQDVTEEVAGYAREGFHGVKIKIGFDVEEDLRSIAAAREAIGPERRLMIDANHGYDLLEALEVGKRAEPYRVDWFEEPVLPEQLATYRAVRDGQPIPVASGENWHGRYAMLEPLSTRAVDIAQPDVCGVGGFTEMRRVVDMAAMFGVRLVPHVWGTAVCLAASLQVMAALPPNPPRRKPIEPIMEFDRTKNPFRQAVVQTPIEHDQGVVRIPEGPGLGIEINRDALRQFALKGDMSVSQIPANTRPLDGPAPKLKAPAGATDCHIHLYLPGFDAQPGGPQIPELATVGDYRKLQRWLSLERVVLTQPNAYQRDNSALLAALDQLGTQAARGVAAVTPETPASDLQAWHAKGVRGARIMNLPGGAVTNDEMLAVEQRIRPLGWHLMVQFNGCNLHDYLDDLRRIEGEYIIDHIGKFMPPVPADDARVDEILRLLDRGNAWFKICAGYEASQTGGPDYADIGAIAKRVIAHAPERILWGPNWPHVGVPREQYPDDAEQLDVLLGWASPEVRQKILVDNPALLYGF